ncbi:MAG TPA: kelch repeat-containing protein [Flavobacteriales bacterium]|nr:kelch repeat-containing protein [Flavobacteriales bacterium]
MHQFTLVLTLLATISSSAQGTWTQLADHPGGPRYAQAAFSVGAKGYVCTGFNGSQNTDQLWAYEPTTDTWTQKTPLPGGARQYASAFTIGDTGYVLCGWDNVNEID